MMGTSKENGEVKASNRRNAITHELEAGFRVLARTGLSLKVQFKEK